MGLRGRLIKGTVLNFIAVAFNQGSTLFVNIIIARILMKDVFGEYAMVQSTLLTVSGLAQLATGYTASKYVSEFRSVNPERAGRIMGLCAIVSVVMACSATLLLIILSPWLADSALKAPHLARALIIGSGFLFFSSINGYQTGVLSGLEAYGGLAKAGIFSGIVAIVTISSGAWWWGLSGALAGLSISALLRCFVHNIWIRYENRRVNIKVKIRGCFAQEKDIIFHFAIPAAIAGCFSIPVIWLGNSILVRQPGGYGEMAYYAAAMNIKNLLLFAPLVITNVASSVLNHVKGAGNYLQYGRLFKFNNFFVFFTASMTAIVLGLLSNIILGMYGPEFISGRNLMFIMLISGVFEATTGSVYQRIQNSGRIWLSFFVITLPLNPLFLLIAFYIVPKLGAIGLGIANVVTAVFSLIGTCVLAWYIDRCEKN
jgi:O-antigen/teichoic acid export membrane protein